MSGIDLDLLLKLRLTVGRFGEMDRARWWNTKGQLGPLGAMALRRGFPRTHYFAQARSVFAVAAHRCAEHYPAPDAVTFWNLGEEIEETFDMRWEHWLDHAEEWSAFFGQIADLSGEDLSAALKSHGLVSESALEGGKRLRRSASGRAVQLPGSFRATGDDAALLALGFACGEPGALAVPYIASPT